MSNAFYASVLEEAAAIKQEWVEAVRNESLVRAAIPRGILRPLIDELFGHILQLLLGQPGKQKKFAGLRSLPEQRVTGHDSLLGLQTILQEGKSLIYKKAVEKYATNDAFLELFHFIDERLCAFFLNVNAYYLTRSAAKNNKNIASRTEEQTVHPSRLNLFYNAFEHSMDGMIITDKSGVILEVNKAFLDLFGYAYEEIIGQKTSILRSSKTSDDFYRSMWESINRTGGWQGEIINRKKNGEEILVLLSITPIYESNQIAGYMAIEIDTRERKEMEERLLQSERLAVIGKMASKVAHEIRNPLSSISLNAEMLEDEIQTSRGSVTKETKILLQSIMGEVDRLVTLTEEYLQFSRLPQSRPTKCHLEEILRETIEFYEVEANSVGIQIIAKIDTTLPPIVFDPQQIRRVILNLLKNGREAMPKGGIIKITLSREGDFARITITDTGEGVPQDKLSRIFEPFYTTKDMGTGLGLPLCKQIVQEHGGRLLLESRQNHGTTFHVELPLRTNEKGPLRE